MNIFIIYVILKWRIGHCISRIFYLGTVTKLLVKWS